MRQKSSSPIVKSPSGKRYKIDFNKVLGQGNFGTVYTGHPISTKEKTDQKPPSTTHAKPVAVKVIPRKLFSQSEYNIFRRFYESEEPIPVNIDKKPKILWIMQLIPGKQLINDRDEIHPLIKKMCYLQRLETILQICEKLNALHRPTSGPSVTHNDLKGTNILLDEKGEPHIIDFGVADEKQGPEATTITTKLKGTPLYMAPEVHEGKYSEKTDTYSMAAVFLIMLGATNPFKNKYATDEKHRTDKKSVRQRHISNADYCFDGLIKPPNEDSCDLKLLPLVRKFLNRMQKKQPEERPNCPKCIKFFQLLILFLQETQDNSAKYTYNVEIYYAKMTLLCYGLWNLVTNNDNKKSKTTLRIFENSFAEIPRAIIILGFAGDRLSNYLEVFVKAFVRSPGENHKYAQAIRILYDSKSAVPSSISRMAKFDENGKNYAKALSIKHKHIPKAILIIENQLVNYLEPFVKAFSSSPEENCKYAQAICILSRQQLLDTSLISTMAEFNQNAINYATAIIVLHQKGVLRDYIHILRDNGTMKKSGGRKAKYFATIISKFPSILPKENPIIANLINSSAGLEDYLDQQTISQLKKLIYYFISHREKLKPKGNIDIVTITELVLNKIAALNKLLKQEKATQINSVYRFFFGGKPRKGHLSKTISDYKMSGSPFICLP